MTQTNYFGSLSVSDYLSWQMQRKRCKNLQRGNCFHTIPSYIYFYFDYCILGSSICQLHLWRQICQCLLRQQIQEKVLLAIIYTDSS